MRKALITGITGQDGSYLAELLLRKGYEVHGIKRRSSLFNTQRINHLYVDPHIPSARLFLHYGDLTDPSGLTRIIQETQPDEIYNLGAMSHVKVSFEAPEYTANVNALGTLRLLESIRLLGLTEKTRFYQASTSEMYGMNDGDPLSEQSPFSPRSPYAASKLYAHWITINYREGYKIFAVNGILFNHESPVRGETFVTRKVSRAVASLSLGINTSLYVGNLDALRDWGHALDYAEAMWLMMQQNEPRDYVIATGQVHSIREMIVQAFNEIGVTIKFSGKGLDEIAKIHTSQNPHLQPGQVVVRIDERYFRPTDVPCLMGDASKAKDNLGWLPTHSFEQIIKEMVHADIKEIAKSI